MQKKMMLRVLKEVRRHLTMETFNCGKDTELVKEETRLWRDTWILPPLDEVIKHLEDEKKNKIQNWGRRYY